ncbi:hypothetical protein [Streptomyces prunicolor]|uniref:hypothetical protein n=1 Tax=Streptomyces prunicolor TaxID=67348 RepID=UPI00036B51F1|nr:hypothetical protein [Streptomyces prunicolor]
MHRDDEKAHTMTQAGTTQERTPAPSRPDPATPVLYICAERSKLTPGLAAQPAEEEGLSFAAGRGLEVVR